jgi:hypothetical protein
MPNSHYDYDPREGIKYAEASKRWATLAILLVLLGACYLVYLFVQSYYGDGGVRVFGVILGVMALVLIIVGVGALVQFMAYRMNMQHHDNVLRGLVAFQREDDRGEIARTVASGVAGVLKSGNQLDSRVLTIADRMARGQTTALVQAQRRDERQQQQDAEQQFWQFQPRFEDDNVSSDDRTPPGW